MAVIVNGDGILTGISSLATALTDITSGRGTVTGVATVGTLQLGTGVSMSSPRSQNAAIFTNNTEFLTVDDAGRVGVGTITPNSDAHPQNVGKINVGFITARSVAGDIDANTMVVAGVSTFVGNIVMNGKNITLGDSTVGSGVDNRLVLGAGSDLQLYHDSTDSRIQNVTGALRVIAGDFKLQNSANTETQMDAAENGAVRLYYDNTVRLATTPSGVDVTGTLNVTGISTFASPVLISDGSVSAGGLAFADDTDTGIFSVAQNTINFATAGVERLELGTTLTVFNDDGADVNFRIEGDTDANLFHLDASADAIGVGGAPGTTGMKMEIFRSTTDAFVNASDCVLRLLNTDTSANTNQTSLQFTTSSTGSGADSAIVSQAEDASGNSRLEFWTDTNNGMSEKASIGSNGNLTINDGDLVIGTSGHGIDFSATSDSGGTSTSELLDDYEEGTCVPTQVNGSFSPSAADGKYTKVGRLCTWMMHIVFDSTSATNHLQIGNFPFTAGGGRCGAGIVRYSNDDEAYEISFHVDGGAATATAYYLNGGGIVQSQAVSAKRYDITFVYETTS